MGKPLGKHAVLQVCCHTKRACSVSVMYRGGGGGRPQKQNSKLGWMRPRPSCTPAPRGSHAKLLSEAGLGARGAGGGAGVQARRRIIT